MSRKPSVATSGKKLPIVYSPSYNISLLGLEKLHPFDAKKYAKIHEYLADTLELSPEQFYLPERVSDAELSLVHSHEYIDSLRKSRNIAHILQTTPLSFLPNSFLRNRLLEPVRLATGGTVLAVNLALDHGWAINLGGGQHHAKADEGAGFNFFADAAIALRVMWKRKPRHKVLIVDLDAHQGDGNAMILGDDKRVAILDMYNNDLDFPGDLQAQSKVTFNLPLEEGTNDAVYLRILRKKLPQAIREHRPQFILYNAGTDVYQGDPLGRLGMTEKGIIERDNFVLNSAVKSRIPVAVVLSGGYHKDSSRIIGKSIETFLRNLKE